jgi:LAO/AO transport system kinase
MCGLRSRPAGWVPPIVKTTAVQNKGITELTDQILAHRQYLEGGRRLQGKRREQIKGRVVRLIEEEISRQVRKVIANDIGLEDAVDRIVSRDNDPYSYAGKIAESFNTYFKGKDRRRE